MLKICVIVLTFCTTIWTLKFENCESSVFTTVYHWENFDMYPLPIIFPGELHMRVKLKILRKLTNPFIDTELYRMDFLTGNVTKVPCVAGTYVGSCQNIDLCKLIHDQNIRPVTVDRQSFQEQIEEILTTPLGTHVECPIQAASNIDKDVTIRLNPLSNTLQKLLNGNYMLKLSVKDTPSSMGNIGCIKFNFTIVDPPTPPTTPTPEPTTTLGGPLPPDQVVG